MRNRALIGVILILALSIVVRVPSLTPLGKFEWLNLQTLLTLSIWNSQGIDRAHYGLIMTYPNEADKWIPYYPGLNVFDQKGNFYYATFPPFAFLLAFYVQKIFGLVPTLVYLKVLILVLSSAAAIVFMETVRRFVVGQASRMAWPLALSSLALFLFNWPVLVWLGVTDRDILPLRARLFSGWFLKFFRACAEDTLLRMRNRYPRRAELFPLD